MHMHIHVVKTPVTCIGNANIRMSPDHLLPGNFDDSTDNHMKYDFGK